MQRLSTYILSIITAIVLGSCHSDDPDTEPTTVAKTIFVFMPYTGQGSNNLYPSLNKNLDDMETALRDMGGLKDRQLVVFIARPDGRTGHLVRFGYKNGKCLRDTVQTYNSKEAYITNEGRTSMLQEVKRLAPARQYAMIVGCHGEGWLPKGEKTKAITRFIGGDAEEYQINIHDFAQSIANAGMKMQFILFDDCYMSGIEMAYDLKDVADWLIGSTSEMMGYGMPYHKLLKYLMYDQPDYAALCTDFISFYSSYRTSNGKLMPYGTIGVTDCSQVGAMADFMKQANATHTFNTTDIESLQDLDADHFTPTVYFDFASYVHRLCADDPTACAQYDDMMQKLVPYKGHTEYIYSYIGNKELTVNEFCGLTVSDPSTNNNVTDSKQQTAWWKGTH